MLVQDPRAEEEQNIQPSAALPNSVPPPTPATKPGTTPATLTRDATNHSLPLSSLVSRDLPAKFAKSLQFNTPPVDGYNTMWCSICRQDVPGSIVPGGGQYCCPRCGEMMPSSNGNRDGTPTQTENANESPPDSAPVSDYDEWEMEERLRHLDRLYARNPLRGPLTQSESNHFRIDARHAPIPREQPASTAQPTEPEPEPSWLVRIGRLALGLGLSITVCGACLAIWAHHGARPDLMPLGIPIAVVGQILLLLGLVFQFDSTAKKPRLAPAPAPTRPTLPTGNTFYRFDDGPDPSPQLTELAARLDELSRRLDNRGEGRS